jgi:NADP-dependent 3-hydroxy acid dehydrogenase YdfG
MEHLRTAGLDERIALVSGATSGIGAATARELVAVGGRVLATARRGERLEALERELNGAARRLVGVRDDVTIPGVIRRLFSASRREFGAEPTALVVSAGHGLPGTLRTSDPNRWRSLLETNCLAVMHQLRDCVDQWLCGRDRDTTTAPRDIVVIGSTIGRQVSEANPIYGSTKFAIHSIVEALRREVCREWVRVTLVEPGFVKSEFQQVAGYDPAWFTGIETDVGPLLTPEDVARVIAFILMQPAHVHIDDVRLRPTRQIA